MLNVIQNCFGFASLGFVIRLKMVHFFLNQLPGVTPKPVVTHSHTFSHTSLWQQIVFALRFAHFSKPIKSQLSFGWFAEMSMSIVIGQRDCFSFGFTTPERKPSFKVPPFMFLYPIYCHLLFIYVTLIKAYTTGFLQKMFLNITLSFCCGLCSSLKWLIR